MAALSAAVAAPDGPWAFFLVGNPSPREQVESLECMGNFRRCFLEDCGQGKRLREFFAGGEWPFLRFGLKRRSSCMH